jgi:hypothetical protein
VAQRSPGEITRLPEEDLALVSSVHVQKLMGGRHFIVFLLMSVTVLAVYLVMNHAFAPGYPVVTAQAEKNSAFADHYPPFRMSEWTNFTIAEDVIRGRLFSSESASHRNPIGFPVLAAPLIRLWGGQGMFYTNAFILWISSLVFFFLLIEMVSFSTAVGATLGLAFATPNLFYAASAFSEPLGQLLTLVSVYLFARGSTAVNDRAFYLCSGLTAGLNLFVQPVLGCLVLIFLAAFVFENGKLSWGETDILFLAGGFAIPLVLYGVLGNVLTGSYTPFLFDPNVSGGEEAQVFPGLWKTFFDIPHGAVVLMPVLMLAPAGFLALWRNSYYSLALISGGFIAVVALANTGATSSIGEGLGFRNLVPVIPMLILPLALLWEEGTGEKAWLAALTALTVVMCTFGWWAGKGDTVADHTARSILLARNGRIAHTVYADSLRVTGQFVTALKQRDIGAWLVTLSPESRTEITGIEREVFGSLSILSRTTNSDMGGFVESVELNGGVRLIVPEMKTEANQNISHVK